MAFVLRAGVRASAVGTELNLELPEGILELHGHMTPPPRGHSKSNSRDGARYLTGSLFCSGSGKFAAIHR